MAFKKTFVICLLIGSSLAQDQATGDQSSSAANNVKRDAPLEGSGGYGPPKETSSSSGPSPSKYDSHSSPTSYSKSIPAAAIRNVETVAVTKTITPVVTKTTTYNTHSEPALSIGHVQGYSQSATGQPKVAPVQFQTQYTTYSNPTVGVNGPVTYTGPAVVFGGAGGTYSLPLTAVSLSSGTPTVYGAAIAQTAAAPASGGWGAPPSYSSSPYGSYSMNIPQILQFNPQQKTFTMQQIQQLQAIMQKNQIAMASALRPVTARAPAQAQPNIPSQFLAAPGTSSGSSHYSSPNALYQAQASARQPIYHQLQPQQHQHFVRQPIAQPSRQYVQTYVLPSSSYTSFQPVNNHHHLLHQHQQLRQQQQRQ
ncbi:unnamed protein product [Orchesella dallaii]|uniref:Uncharacterized protein n=1 Tax=Orchesella dallaii TaxID=48710 RepID=A0ABP1S0P9_9HEXA